MGVRSRSLGVTIGVVVFVAAACTPQDVGSTDKAGGGAAKSVVLDMASAYGDSRNAPAVMDFVARVGDLSNGALTIDVHEDWGHNRPNLEQSVVSGVAAGDADLGWAGSRVFDTLGVTSFAALTAPMLIDSYPLEQAVIDSEIPTPMLDGLKPLGVTGLGVLAGGLRKPIAVAAPLVDAADWQGLTFDALRSDESAAAIRALGAEPTDVVVQDLDDGLRNGTIDGFEKSLLTVSINGTERIAPYIAANVNLWPEVPVLFANTERFAALSDEQRGWLTAAARATAASSTALLDDAATLADLCSGGARARDATLEQLAALRAAFEPVYATTLADPATRSAIAAISRLKATTPAGDPLALPPACTAPLDPAPHATAAPTPAPTSSALDGTYRWVLTQKDALDHGSADDKTASGQANYPSTFTLTLADGIWSLNVEQASGEPDLEGPGRFTVDGDQITFFAADGNRLLTASYTVTGRDLKLHRLTGGDPGDTFVWTTKPLGATS